MCSKEKSFFGKRTKKKKVASSLRYSFYERSLDC